MKSVVLGFLVGLSCSAVSAQDWCHPGSVWRYQFISIEPGVQGDCTLEARYIGDSLFQGLPCQHIRANLYCTINGALQQYPAASYFTTTSPDLIRAWNHLSMTFDTLVWFGAAPGASWSIHGSVDQYRINVLDAGASMVNGIELRHVVVSGDPSWLGYSPDTIRERVGALQLFSPWPTMTYQVDGSNGPLWCYQDDLWSYLSPYGTVSCDQPLAVQDVIDGSLVHELKVYPLPLQDEMFVEYPSLVGAGILQVWDACGRLELTLPVAAGSQSMRVKLPNIRAGFHIVRLAGDIDGQRWIEVIVDP
jgi:hypothetical protein